MPQAQLLGSNTLPAAAVEVVPMPGGQYHCSYTAPAVAGLYVLEVTSAGKHLQGSPFSVKVGARLILSAVIFRRIVKGRVCTAGNNCISWGVTPQHDLWESSSLVSG
jgi:hypothetical protein